MNDFDAVKAHYRSVAHLITRPDEWGIDAYAWSDPEIGIRLTPIEEALWHDIRGENVIMYPQYPVGRFFVDFGNPGARVALECDGAQWHRDQEHDRARQAEIERLGWSVYRIGGADCFTDAIEGEDQDGNPFCRPGLARLFIREVIAHHPQIQRWATGDFRHVSHEIHGRLERLFHQFEASR